MVINYPRRHYDLQLYIFRSTADPPTLISDLKWTSFAPSPHLVSLWTKVQITAENYTWLLTWNIWNWRVFPGKSDTLFVYSVSVCSFLRKELTYFLTYLSKNWHFTQTPDNKIVRKSISTCWRFSKNHGGGGRFENDKCGKNWHVGLKLHT